ncbi:putative developmentally regulated protein [Leishmania major strain Friedlin]|uniref:Putative developmentally regulated protein n=1 Tax=Leishmania major TaxID=5664 RepID=Q4QF77_LEIMA|nr:putative developmentally regulated protein [Leishmania major strain Friedlin]XP_001682021.1 putative developmentally regulated protein [Leishmania major strain Friedlin]XP_001682023.1 putative developmentally regulated protein [Leishmania major strain Friedlin]XP_001682025.1 putative developmentally regulated protein [Leishmania major strain Friedlin]XP_001682027.1 putative developmentally regulated protein [Leishmania major strain Friedlin]XP_001682029.1 putative developmentally regulated |eukprot:XP_001682019.1 putative developmentally regulated protein [Leishmania major strain Friedlin]
MTVFWLEQWWKRKDHRKIRGARGARFASLRFHGAFILSVLVLVEYVFRSTDNFTARHFADPPLLAPPPLPTSLGYSMTSEMPHLKSLELEREAPAHLPRSGPLDLKGLRGEGRPSG